MKNNIHKKQFIILNYLQATAKALPSSEHELASKESASFSATAVKFHHRPAKDAHI